MFAIVVFFPAMFELARNSNSILSGTGSIELKECVSIVNRRLGKLNFLANRAKKNSDQT